MNSIVIVSSTRTPVGAFQGALSTLPAPKLGAVAIREACRRANVDPKTVDEVILGCVLSAGVGQAPARQAAIYAGLPSSVRCLTVNKVCGSGLKAVSLAAATLAQGDGDVVVAGGMESMSQTPYGLMNARSGFRLGHQKVVDLMIHDGLWDPTNDFHMGSAAELCVKKYKYSRQTQDEFAINSFKKAQESIARGLFAQEMVPVDVTDAKGQVTQVTVDEGPSKVNFEKIPKLKPVFDKEGTVTAANASTLNDGAAALVLMREDTAKKKGVPVQARVVAQAEFAQDPAWFTTAPVGAIRRVLEKAKLTVKDIDIWEINEAFAVVTLAAMDELKIDPKRVNIRGGAIALGHPIGCSGARVLVTLLHTLQQENRRYGLATLCIGGGEAIAMIIENIR